jgi:hypothetical protein
MLNREREEVELLLQTREYCCRQKARSHQRKIYQVNGRKVIYFNKFTKVMKGGLTSGSWVVMKMSWP